MAKSRSFTLENATPCRTTVPRGAVQTTRPSTGRAPRQQSHRELRHQAPVTEVPNPPLDRSVDLAGVPDGGHGYRVARVAALAQLVAWQAHHPSSDLGGARGMSWPPATLPWPPLQ